MTYTRYTNMPHSGDYNLTRKHLWQIKSNSHKKIFRFNSRIALFSQFFRLCIRIVLLLLSPSPRYKNSIRDFIHSALMRWGFSFCSWWFPFFINVRLIIRPENDFFCCRYTNFGIFYAHHQLLNITQYFKARKHDVICCTCFDTNLTPINAIRTNQYVLGMPYSEKNKHCFKFETFYY